MSSFVTALDSHYRVEPGTSGQTGVTTVSVVVPTRDRPKLLREALASIRAVEGPDLHFEILVADNGADAETAAVAETFGAVRISVTRPGAAAARNVALGAATTEFIAFLDDDDIWTGSHIRPHLALLRDAPDIGAVLGQVSNVAEDLSEVGVPWPAELGRPNQVFRQMLGFYPQIGATVVRSEVALKVGRFDEALESDEDWDWHLRLALATQVGFVPQMCLFFRQRGPSGGDLEWRRMKYLRIVMWRNLQRAPNRGRLIFHALTAFARHRGGYAHYFAEQAIAARAKGSRSAVRRELTRAFLASPFHSAVALGRRSVLRPTLSAFLPGRTKGG